MAQENGAMIPTVTITVDEYLDLRQKAEMNCFLMTQLGEMREKIFNIENKMFALKGVLEGGKR